MMNMCLLLIIINFVLIETGAFPVNINCGTCVSNKDGVADCSRTTLPCVRVFSPNDETMIREVYVSRCSQKIYPRKWQKFTKKLGPGNAVSCYGKFVYYFIYLLIDQKNPHAAQVIHTVYK